MHACTVGASLNALSRRLRSDEVRHLLSKEAEMPSFSPAANAPIVRHAMLPGVDDKKASIKGQRSLSRATQVAPMWVTTLVPRAS